MWRHHQEGSLFTYTDLLELWTAYGLTDNSLARVAVARWRPVAETLVRNQWPVLHSAPVQLRMPAGSVVIPGFPPHPVLLKYRESKDRSSGQVCLTSAAPHSLREHTGPEWFVLLGLLKDAFPALGALSDGLLPSACHDGFSMWCSPDLVQVPSLAVWPARPTGCSNCLSVCGLDGTLEAWRDRSWLLPDGRSFDITRCAALLLHAPPSGDSTLWNP